LTLNVLQLAASTTASTLSVNYLKTFSVNAGDNGYFILTSNTSWQIASYPGWLTVSPLSGTGDARVNVTVQANSGPQRTGTITISGTGVAEDVSINALQVSGSVKGATSPNVVPDNTIYYYPFTSLGYSILDKYLLAQSSVTETGFLIQASGSFDFENNYYESDDVSFNTSTSGGLINVNGASSPTSVKIINNVIEYSNTVEYCVLVGSDSYLANTVMYDGTQFIGNKVTGLGSTGCSTYTETLFLGWSGNGIWQYNFLSNCPYGICSKSSGLSNANGYIAYNAIKNPKYGITVKGISNTTIVNNTIYLDNTVCSYATAITLNLSDDGTQGCPRTTIENNIIYSSGTCPYMIQIGEYSDLASLVCDYNVYYVSGGTPTFMYTDQNGNTRYASFSQWQALGFDSHSVVINPGLDPVSLVPASAVQHATNLGPAYITGIDPSNTWNRAPAITKAQDATWQNGAFIK
jgi:hypothetical protein